MALILKRADVALSVRLDGHVATNFAQCLLNPIFRFVGGRLIEVRCRFVGFDRNADEESFGCFAAPSKVDRTEIRVTNFSSIKEARRI